MSDVFIFAVAIMKETGPEQVHSMGTWIQVVNVVFWLKLCFMFLQITEQSFGKMFD